MSEVAGGPNERTVRAFTLRVRGHEHLDLVVESFEGRERSHEPWRFTLEVTATLDAESLLGALGSPASFVLRTAPVPRRFDGVLVSARVLRVDARSGRVDLRLGVASKLWTLRFRKRSRVFQGLAVPEVVRRVLAEAGIPSRWSLRQAYPAREFCVQYAETDLDFVERLLAEAGIALRHVPTEERASGSEVGADEVWCVDEPRQRLPLVVDGPPAAETVLIWRDASDLEAARLGDVTRFEARRRLRPTKATYREYDPENPGARLEVSAEVDGVAGDELEHDEHEAPFGFRKWDFARAEPERSLRRLRRRAVTYFAESVTPGVVAGAGFRLEGHPSEAARAEFMVTRVEHRGRARPSEGGAPLYSNRFECVPADVLDVPRARRRPRVLATLTATVVGPPNEEIHCDELGRIRVRFHWDRRDPRDEATSCWIRAMQAWGGEGWGSLFLPRVGMEVVVAFEDGDPDKPLVLGAVYNGTHPPPFRLPAERATSGIRTRSTPRAEGYNELSFDDTAGRERVFLRAEKELRVEVGTDRHTHVERDESLAVAGSQALEVRGDRFARVLGARTDETLGATTTKTLGDARAVIGGELVTEVGGGERHKVAGDRALVVERNSLTEVKMQHAVACGGAFTVQAGSRERPAGVDLYAWGGSTIAGAGEVRISSEQRVELVCGSSRITLTPERIELHAARIDVVAEERVRVGSHGPTLLLGDDAELSGRRVTLTSTKASLRLDEDAHVDGARVLLACGGVDPGPRVDEDGRPLTKPLELTLLAPDYTPHAHKEFVVTSAGRRIEGRTGGDGSLTVAIPIEATSAEVLVWLDARPEGRTRRYVVDIAALAAPSTILGLRQRLRHLGYDGRTPAEELDQAAKVALARFQKDRGLPATGAVDGATLAELERAHGH